MRRVDEAVLDNVVTRCPFVHVPEAEAWAWMWMWMQTQQ
jgi:hypothetical protein